MKVLNGLKEIVDHSDGEEFVLNLGDLSNKDYIKTLYFLIGLTYKNGSIIKLQSKVFKVIC